MSSATVSRQLSFDSEFNSLREAPQPEVEVYCNLRDITVPIDNDITFGVETDTDRIVVDDPGSQTLLAVGDM